MFGIDPMDRPRVAYVVVDNEGNVRHDIKLSRRAAHDASLIAYEAENGMYDVIKNRYGAHGRLNLAELIKSVCVHVEHVYTVQTQSKL